LIYSYFNSIILRCFLLLTSYSPILFYRHKKPSVMSKITNKKPLIIAVETSGRIGSVALAQAGQLLSQTTFKTPVKHSSELFPAISALLSRFELKPLQIDHIYISLGPGSFTGLRIAVTLAKILHLANNKIKIVTVDSLDATAANATEYIKQNHTRLNKIAAVTDAKRGQFFIAAYKFDSEKTTAFPWRKILDDCLMSPQQFMERFSVRSEPIWLLGEGLVYYKEKFEAEGIKFLDEKYWPPKASNIHLLGYQLAVEGKFADPLTIQPKYLRRPDIRPK